MGKASTRAQNKYIAKAYDRVNLTLPKGGKAIVQAHATDRGESVNGFIGRAITETMERDATQMPVEATQTQSGEGVVSLPSGTQKRAGEAADVQGEGKAPVWLSGSVDLPPKMLDAVEGMRTEGETPVAVLWRVLSAVDRETVQAAGVVALSVETVEKAQAAADRTGENVPEFISRAVETQARRDRARKKPIERT